MAGGINAPFGLSPYQNLIGGGNTTKIQTFNIAPTTASIFAGDPVVMAQATAGVNAAAPGTIVPLSSLPANAQATAVIVGYLESVSYVSPTSIYGCDFPYWAAGSLTIGPIKAYVNVDPNIVLQVQVSTSQAQYAGAVFLNSMINMNGRLMTGGVAINNGVPAALAPITQNPPAGNAKIGTSAYYLDGSTLVTAAALQIAAAPALVTANFKVLGIVESQAVNTIGIQNQTAASFINGLTPGADMPFITVYGVINNHIYRSGTPSNIILQ